MLASGSTERPPRPTTGMRGGLGKILLSAFWFLAIVPLIVISLYATVRQRHDIQREVTAKLSSVASMMETQVCQWAEQRTATLSLLAALPNTEEHLGAIITGTGTSGTIEAHDAADAEAARSTLRAQLDAILEQDEAFRRLDVLDGEGRILVSTSSQDEGLPTYPALVLDAGEYPSLQFITPVSYTHLRAHET